MPSALPEDGAPSARLVAPRAPPAPTHPGVPPGPLASLPRPREPASGRPKGEDVATLLNQVVEVVADRNLGGSNVAALKVARGPLALCALCALCTLSAPSRARRTLRSPPPPAAPLQGEWEVLPAEGRGMCTVSATYSRREYAGSRQTADVTRVAEACTFLGDELRVRPASGPRLP